MRPQPLPGSTSCRLQNFLRMVCDYLASLMMFHTVFCMIVVMISVLVTKPGCILNHLINNFLIFMGEVLIRQNRPIPKSNA